MRLAFLTRWASGSRERAEEFIGAGIDDWTTDGELQAEDAAELRSQLATPEVAAVTANLGVHLAMSVPLRFPLGSLARFGWTLAARVRAQWPAMRGNEDAREKCSIHSAPVMLLGLVPGLGAGAYLLAEPLRSHPALSAIIMDRLMRKLPVRLYHRLHLIELTTWWARPVSSGSRSPWRQWIRERFATLKPHRRLVVAVLTVDMVALALAAFLHFGLDATWAFSEFGFMNTLNVAQLLAAGTLGILAFRLFWRGTNERAQHSDRSGIFLWGSLGLGMTAFAFDDFFGIHERLGGWIAENANVLPIATNNADDIMTLMYGVIGLAVLAVFRHELFATRASSALLVAGVLAAGLMLVTDSFAPGPVKALEFPSQAGAVGILFLALLVRYMEIRSEVSRNASIVGEPTGVIRP